LCINWDLYIHRSQASNEPIMIASCTYQDQTTQRSWALKRDTSSASPNIGLIFPRRPDGRNQTAPGRPWGLRLPQRGTTKCVRIVRRPPPGSGYRLLKGSEESRPMKGFLGAGTDRILKPFCRSQELVSVFAALGQRPRRANFFASCGEVTDKESIQRYLKFRELEIQGLWNFAK
jgi:hypothetical protein